MMFFSCFLEDRRMLLVPNLFILNIIFYTVETEPVCGMKILKSQLSTLLSAYLFSSNFLKGC